MPEEIVMPRLSDTMSEGTIARWLKKEGDSVKTGEALFEVETDKATLELQSYHDGTLVKILMGDGSTAPIGTPVGILAKEGEEGDVSQLGGGGSAQAASAAGGAAPPEPPGEAAADAGGGPGGKAHGRVEDAKPEMPARDPGSAGSPAPAEDVKASPLARVLAEQSGVDLRSLAGKGSGPNGRIVRQDVESAARQAPGQAAALTPAPSDPESQDRELNRVRQAIARNLALSKPGAPHIYLTMEIEMDAALALYKQLNELVEDEQSRLTVNDLVMKATALALRKYSDLNAHFMDEKPPKLRLFNRINLTVAVPGEHGLMVPVVKDVDKKPLSQIAREAKEMYGRIRSNKPAPDDFQGGTFAVSNLGRWGIDEFQAVINPPQVGILAIGAASPQPVARDGKVEIRSMMRVTISADHRAVDGVYAADFLVELKRLLEHPLSLVI
ncbi:MAG TPA: dihydrolipoamide acetyltransferase family protein [Chloroflexota bacterium]|nr:dihydrolipoamide acetyltransferase family protein [Chloroflexota bacterium]